MIGLNRDELVCLAEKAGIEIDGEDRNFAFDYGTYNDQIEKFAALVAAAEREACAKICDSFADDPVYCGNLIRARGAK